MNHPFVCWLVWFLAGAIPFFLMERRRMDITVEYLLPFCFISAFVGPFLPLLTWIRSQGDKVIIKKRRP